MALEKASGVYLTITDNSFQTSGTQSLNVVVPMLTTKGNIGLNYVTADTLDDVIGPYDPTFCPNYYGIKRILENVSYAQVWRLNQNSKIANAYYSVAKGDKNTNSDARTIEDVKQLSSVLAVGHKSTGNWQTTAVKFNPAFVSESVQNQHPITSSTQEITFTSISKTETTSINETEVLGSCIFFDSTDSIIVGCIKKVDSSFNVYPVIDGNISDTSCGTAEFTGNDIKITLQSEMSGDSFWNVHTISSELNEWTVTVASKDSSTYSIQNTYNFSFDPENENYIDNVDFGDIFIKADKFDPSWTDIRSYFTLESGSNGDSSIVAGGIDLSVLDDCGCNILAMNGITDYKIVNRLVNSCEKNKIHIFADAPAYSAYIDVENWAKNITRSEYVVIGARPDKTEIATGKVVYIYPSVNYVLIYASMLSNFGSLNYPPAGATTGVISTEDLIKCDYELYANELKTNRINWQRSNNIGTMMWEQRTTYGLNTDLSYIAPTFIVDAVADELITFEQNFNFRYMTRSDLLNQESGIKSILQNYIDNNYLFSYKLKMPSYEEAQKSGRTLNIGIEIVVMKDSEVININLILNNA